MKYFTEREFSGIFSLAGGGILHLRKGNSRWPCLEERSTAVLLKLKLQVVMISRVTYLPFLLFLEKLFTADDVTKYRGIPVLPYLCYGILLSGIS